MSQSTMTMPARFIWCFSTSSGVMVSLNQPLIRKVFFQSTPRRVSSLWANSIEEASWPLLQMLLSWKSVSGGSPSKLSKPNCRTPMSSS